MVRPPSREGGSTPQRSGDGLRSVNCVIDPRYLGSPAENVGCRLSVLPHRPERVTAHSATLACNFVTRATDAITLFPLQRGDQDRWRKVSGGVREGGPSPTTAYNFVP